MLEIALAVLLIAHGLVHSILASAPNPAAAIAKPGAFFTSVERTWLLPQRGISASTIRWTGIILVVISTVGFVMAGLGILGIPGLSTIWRSAAVVSASVSLLLLILFWHPWLVIGVLIDVAVLATLLWANWPTREMIGS